MRGWITASVGADQFIGTAFDDTFSGLQNGDTAVGGAGVDTVVFTDVANHSIDLAAPANFLGTKLILSGIENLTGNAGVDDLRGTSVGNILLGAAGNDLLQGRLGDDTLGGGALDDLLRGDAGADLLNGGDGNDSLLGLADNDLIFGGVGDDRGRGADGDDTVNGESGNDRLFGGDVVDNLTGGDGNDILNGDAGDHVLFGGTGNDTLRGEDGSDEIYGGAGNDVLRALSGALLIDGGSFTDTLVLADKVFGPGNSGVHIDLTGDFDILGLIDDYDRLGATVLGVENVTGTAGDDFIAGDGNVNVLRSGQGEDMLYGRNGADTLVGNAGADGFVFAGPTGGADQIADFEMAADKIWLVQDSFGNIGSGNLATRLTINATGTVAANANAQLIYDNAGAGFGTLSFDADGNGADAAVTFAVLVPTTNELVALATAKFGFL